MNWRMVLIGAALTAMMGIQQNMWANNNVNNEEALSTLDKINANLTAGMMAFAENLDAGKEPGVQESEKWKQCGKTLRDPKVLRALAAILAGDKKYLSAYQSRHDGKDCAALGFVVGGITYDADIEGQEGPRSQKEKLLRVEVSFHQVPDTTIYLNDRIVCTLYLDQAGKIKKGWYVHWECHDPSED